MDTNTVAGETHNKLETTKTRGDTDEPFEYFLL